MIGDGNGIEPRKRRQFDNGHRHFGLDDGKRQDTEVCAEGSGGGAAVAAGGCRHSYGISVNVSLKDSITP